MIYVFFALLVMDRRTLGLRHPCMKYDSLTTVLETPVVARGTKAV